MTIVWYVDNLKVSHVDPKQVTEIIEWLKTIYGDLKVSLGKMHEYLQMDLDFTTSGEVKLSMIPYIKNILRQFPEEIGRSVTTPASNHLFQVSKEGKSRPLLEEQALVFHHTTAQLLFITSQV